MPAGTVSAGAVFVPWGEVVMDKTICISTKVAKRICYYLDVAAGVLDDADQMSECFNLSEELASVAMKLEMEVDDG